jgi:anti-anti-sigma factor
MFDIKLDEEKKILLSGRFSAANSAQAESIFTSVKGDCVVDMKGLEYISSAGIGTLVKTYLRLKESGNSIKLINVNKHITEVLRYSGLDKVLTIE